MCLIVSLAQPRNTIVNKSRHLTFRRETVANFINVDKLHLACFSTAKYKETFSIQCYLVLPTTQNSGAARLTTLPSPVEQVSCVRPRTSHSNRNCQQRQTTPPLPARNMSKESCSQGASPGELSEQTAGPIPGAANSTHLRHQSICFSD